ncbi:MAG TPA: molecular chaperone TorD family protein [Lacipirellulaceae bacterium]
MATTKHETVDFDVTVNMARQALYRFAALSLVDPRAGSWQQLRYAANDRLLFQAAALVRSLPEVRLVELGIGERPVELLDPGTVLQRLPKSHDALNAEFENTFGLVVGSACPPYETEYIASKFTFQRSNSLADINGFYEAFGLTIANGRAERPDHVALELEFMASLLGLERRAISDHLDNRGELLTICRKAQVRFLKEHVAWWVPAFAKLLARENEGGYYAAVGLFLAALIPAERALLHVDIQSRPIRPSREESPDACQGCQLGSWS